MHLIPISLRLRGTVLSQSLRNTLHKISWKSPHVIGGLSIIILLAGGLTFYLSTTISASTLMINGQQIGLVHTVDTGNNLVATIMKQHGEPYGIIAKTHEENKITSVNFTEKVTVQEAEIQADQMKQIDQAFKVLMDGKIDTKDYTVQSNDSWWLIARKNNMLTDEVLAGNPGTTEDAKLQPGKIIKLVTSTPYLTVVSQGTYSGSETIPFDVVIKADNSLRSGQTKVIKQGSNGSKLVTYSYVQKNGIDVTKQILDEKITQTPVNQEIAKGPNNRPFNVAFAVSRGGSGSSSIVDRALSLQGTPYVFGGTSRGGLDCSGFTKYVYSSSGISLPRTSYAQFSSGVAVSKNNLQQGDLVFFTTYSEGASHVGIYIGRGRFVHASSPSSGVKISSLSDNFYSSRYLGARSYN